MVTREEKRDNKRVARCPGKWLVTCPCWRCWRCWRSVNSRQSNLPAVKPAPGDLSNCSWHWPGQISLDVVSTWLTHGRLAWLSSPVRAAPVTSSTASKKYNSPGKQISHIIIDYISTWLPHRKMGGGAISAMHTHRPFLGQKSCRVCIIQCLIVGNVKTNLQSTMHVLCKSMSISILGGRAGVV